MRIFLAKAEGLENIKIGELNSGSGPASAPRVSPMIAFNGLLCEFHDSVLALAEFSAAFLQRDALLIRKACRSTCWFPHFKHFTFHQGSGSRRATLSTCKLLIINGMKGRF